MPRVGIDFERLRTVLDDKQTPPTRQVHDRLHVHSHAEQVSDDDRPRAVRARSLQTVQRRQTAVGNQVHRYWNQPVMGHNARHIGNGQGT